MCVGVCVFVGWGGGGFRGCCQPVTILIQLLAPKMESLTRCNLSQMSVITLKQSHILVLISRQGGCYLYYALEGKIGWLIYLDWYWPLIKNQMSAGLRCKIKQWDLLPPWTQKTDCKTSNDIHCKPSCGFIISGICSLFKSSMDPRLVFLNRVLSGLNHVH